MLAGVVAVDVFESSASAPAEEVLVVIPVEEGSGEAEEVVVTGRLPALRFGEEEEEDPEVMLK